MSESEPEKAGPSFTKRVGKKNYPPSRQKKSISVEVAHGDMDALEVIMETLGVGQSEAIRTSIRVYAALLKK